MYEKELNNMIKFKYFKLRSSFDLELSKNNINESDVCFIEDEKIIFTHNTQYKLYNEKILFESSEPVLENITLSDSLSNYKYIEIFATTNDKHCFCTKLDSPNDKKVVLHTTILGNESFFIKSKVYTCLDNKLTLTAGSNGNLLAGEIRLDTGVFTRDNTYVKVYKIIGYK